MASEREHTEKSPLAVGYAKMGVMRAFFSLAACAVGLVACLDDPEENLASRSSAVGPAPDWTVTSGVEPCDAHLRNACPRAAVACLEDTECKALVTCIRECTMPEELRVHSGARADDGDDDRRGEHGDVGDCVQKCGQDHRPPWRLYDPFNECATESEACR